MQNTDDADRIENTVNRFVGWLRSYGYTSYDQFDFWGSALGVFGKRLFLKNKMAAAPLVLGLQLLESFLPRARCLFATKKRFAIGDAHFALGFQNRFRLRQRPKDLEESRRLLQALLSCATPTPGGMGWGYPYTWVTASVEYPPGTPFVTVTPYGYDALVGMHDLTGEDQWLAAARSVAGFVADDLAETVLPDGAVAAGYGLGDHKQVVNANAYRAALLLDAHHRFGETPWRDKALGNLRFVLGQQRPDGSWPYAPDEPFIDHFHTCFVLKNLYRSYQVMKDPDLLAAVNHGYAYYRRRLFRSDGSPRHFARSTRPKFRRIEMYDYAESILLGVLLRDEIKNALPFSLALAGQLVGKYQMSAGYFVTRVTPLRTRNTVPYLRWPQAQLFHALTALLLALSPSCPKIPDQTER